jgi:O-antigen ligase
MPVSFLAFRTYEVAMELARRLPIGTRIQAVLAGVDIQGLAIWLLGFLLVVYLGLSDGGYDPLVQGQIGIAIWWGLLLGLAVGALPVRAIPRPAQVALGAFAIYVAWVGLSAIWSSSPDRSLEDLARVTTYLGVFALAMTLRGSKAVRRMVGAVGSAIVVIAIVGLASRLHPSWFPGADETVSLLSATRSRLAYPIGYWNGLAALVGVGLPLVLYLATSSKRMSVQVVGAAAMPLMMLTLYFTFSRGGVLAAAVGMAAFMALSTERIRRAATLIIAGIGATILILAAHQRSALEEGTSNGLARHQGDEILAMAIVVCAGVGLIQASLVLYLRHRPLPAWATPSRATSRSFLAVGLTLALVLVVAFIASGRASHGWNEFKDSGGTGNSTSRLESVSSNGRVPYWEVAIDEFNAHPLIGGGSGSYEDWWAKNRGEKGGFVQDAHSLYVETLAELGIVGEGLLMAFLLPIFYFSFRAYRRASRSVRTQMAAALAAMLAFAVGASYDWLWELPVLPVSFLLLAATVLTAGSRTSPGGLNVRWRAGLVLSSLLAMIAIAVPLATATSLRESQAAVQAKNLQSALTKADAAANLEPFAAGPHLQVALILEQEGRLTDAEAAAREAVSREPDEWRSWVVLSRLAAKRGQVASSIEAYERAKNLNPRSALFQS